VHRRCGCLIENGNTKSELICVGVQNKKSASLRSKNLSVPSRTDAAALRINGVQVGKYAQSPVAGWPAISSWRYRNGHLRDE
jgi:hypothetical protein